MTTTQGAPGAKDDQMSFGPWWMVMLLVFCIALIGPTAYWYMKARSLETEVEYQKVSGEVWKLRHEKQELAIIAEWLLPIDSSLAEDRKEKRDKAVANIFQRIAGYNGDVERVRRTIRDKRFDDPARVPAGKTPMDPENVEFLIVKTTP